MWQLIARRHSTVHSFVGLCGVGRWGHFSCRITTQRDSCSLYFDSVKTLCSLSKNKKREPENLLFQWEELSHLSLEYKKKKGKTLFRTKFSNGKDTHQNISERQGGNLKERQSIPPTVFFSLKKSMQHTAKKIFYLFF
jgi:hypothetical protein